jgi:hypothetical protein
MRDASGKPVLKQWKFVTSSARVAESLSTAVCSHGRDFQHGEISGNATKPTETYSVKLCRMLLSSLFGPSPAPGLACQPCANAKKGAKDQHREHEVCYGGFGVSPFMCAHTHFGLHPVAPDEGGSDEASAHPSLNRRTRRSARMAVTKLLDRVEMRADPLARAAVKAEGKALVGVGTWDESSVCEKDDLIKWARQNKVTIHLGELMTICSVKFWECHPSKHKYKGRVCFRGDNARDQDGVLAVYQEMSSSPTAVHSANSNLAYGCLPGHRSKQADAVRAYVQALLKSLFETWVRVPKELWPEEWHKLGYQKPMCRLIKALYGHPEAGGHWEKHLTEAVSAAGGVPVQNHPSSFWFEADRCLLTVYVDDLLLSGPSRGIERIFDALRHGKHPISLDDPEPLGRFLGRSHVEV